MLALFFNSIVEALSHLILRVKRMTEEVKDASERSRQHLGKLVQTAARQLEHMQNASEEVKAVTHASRQVAEYAAHLSQEAHHARQVVLEGRARVQETSAGMSRLLSYVQTTATHVDHLGTSSQEIGEITEVLTHLVHAMQRLALDAAIQAAMAGPAGKGFSAVAEDIRRLSEQAKEEATRISKIVSSVLQEIKQVTGSMQATHEETMKGDRYVAGTGDLLETMFGLVDQQAGEIERIHVLCREQLASCEACVRIIGEVSTATQQSSVSIQEVSSHMNTLFTRASILQQIVDTFQLAESPAMEGANRLQVRRSTERPW